MKPILLLAFSLCFLCSSSQQPIAWQVRIGGNETEYSNAIDTAKDGSIYAAGFIRSRTGEYTMQYTSSPDPLSPDAWIVKYNRFGVLQWQKSFGGTQPDEFYDVKATPDGGAIAVGRSGSADGHITNNKGGEDIVVAKYDAAGNLEWNQNYGTTLLDGARTVTVMPDSSYVLSCYSNGTNKDLSGGKGGRDVWLIQISTTGAIIRKKNFGGSSEDDPIDTKFYNNTWIITGSTGSTNGDVTGFRGGTDVWVVKLDAAWVLQKQKCFGGTGQDAGYSIVPLPDGYAVAARVNSNTGDVTGLKGGYDGWMIKTDFDLNAVWTKTYGGASNDYFSALALTQDGMLLAAGETASTNDDITSNAGIADGWLIKINPADGTKIWSQTFGETKGDRINDVMIWGNNDYLFGGMLSLVVNPSNIHTQLWIGTSRQLVVAATLPVKLISFEGRQNSGNLLTWLTSGETNSKEYGVERSSDGANFINIGTIAAAGNTTALQHYQFVDQQPFTKSWYRLRIADRNGKEEFSSVIFIKAQDAGGAKLFPSIASLFITVELNSESRQTAVVTVTDALGRAMKKQTAILSTGTNRFIVDVSELAKGAYYFLLTEKGKTTTLKFLKE